MKRFLKSIIISNLLFISLTYAKAKEKRFAQGKIEFGLGLGFGVSGDDNTYLLAGGSLGYFIFRQTMVGIEVGSRFSLRGEEPIVTKLCPSFKFILYDFVRWAPFLSARFGRIFVSKGKDDGWYGGGGGGVISFFAREFGIELGLEYLYYMFPEDRWGDLSLIFRLIGIF